MGCCGRGGFRRGDFGVLSGCESESTRAAGLRRGAGGAVDRLSWQAGKWPSYAVHPRGEILMKRWQSIVCAAVVALVVGGCAGI